MGSSLDEDVFLVDNDVNEIAITMYDISTEQKEYLLTAKRDYDSRLQKQKEDSLIARKQYLAEKKIVREEISVKKEYFKSVLLANGFVQQKSKKGNLINSFGYEYNNSLLLVKISTKGELAVLSATPTHYKGIVKNFITNLTLQLENVNIEGNKMLVANHYSHIPYVKDKTTFIADNFTNDFATILANYTKVREHYMAEQVENTAKIMSDLTNMFR